MRLAAGASGAAQAYPSSCHHIRNDLSSQSFQWGPMQLCTECWGHHLHSCLAKNRISCGSGSGTQDTVCTVPLRVLRSSGPDLGMNITWWLHDSSLIYSPYTFTKKDYLIVAEMKQLLPELDSTYLSRLTHLLSSLTNDELSFFCRFFRESYSFQKPQSHHLCASLHLECPSPLTP